MERHIVFCIGIFFYHKPYKGPNNKMKPCFGNDAFVIPPCTFQNGPWIFALNS